MHDVYFLGKNTLQNLSLANNLLTQIPDYLFKHLESAKMLYLQNNLILNISSNSLAGLIALQVLNMTGNRLPLLPLGVFDAVGSLTTLLLANNAIRRIDQKPFQSQAHLVTLDLSNNNIENVTSDWFLTTQQLQVVLLNRNKIQTINMTSMSSALPQLVRLNLSDNLLTRVDNVFTNWPSLRSLDLSRNPLGLRNGGIGLSSSFSGLTSLKWLDLSGLCLTSFEGGVQLPNLQSLLLADNQLTNVTVAMLSAAPALQTLDISSNNIVKIEPLAFASLRNLTQVNMSGNALTGDQLTAAGLTASATVDVSWNNIVSLSPIPRQDGGIYLRGNPLTCANCNSSSSQATPSSSWWPTNSRLLLDASKTTCLQSTTNTPVLAVCSCPSSASVAASLSADCSVPLSLTQAQYLLGFSRTSRTCPYDVNILNPNRPRFGSIQASPTSLSSVEVAWNVTDPQNAAVSVSIVAGLSAACFNESSILSNMTDLNSIVYRVEYNVNQTDCNITGLTMSAMYAVCGQVLVPTSATSNSTTPSDTRCKCVKLPVVTATTSTEPPLPLPVILLTVVPGELSVLVTWRVDGSTTGSSSLAQFDSFRLTCARPSSEDTWSEIIYSNSSSSNSSDAASDGQAMSATIQGLSSSTTYNVCVEAANGRVVQCKLTTTLATSSQPTTVTSSHVTTTIGLFSSSEASSETPAAASTSKKKSNVFLIIVIVVPVAAFLIILLVIICIVLCCVARRRRRQRESQSQSKQQATVQRASAQQAHPQPTPLPSITATTKLPEVTSYEDDLPDISVINMSEQSLVSLSVYDLRNPI